MAAKLIIHRAVPFARGDQSIRIWIDGKDAGMLPAQEPFICDLAPGRHKVRAWMNGGSGNKLIIQAQEGERITLTLSGTHMPSGSWWDYIVMMLVFFIPGDIFSGRGMWIKSGVMILLLGLFAYRWSLLMRSFLKLEVFLDAMAKVA